MMTQTDYYSPQVFLTPDFILFEFDRFTVWDEILYNKRKVKRLLRTEQYGQKKMYTLRDTIHKANIVNIKHCSDSIYC